MPASVVTNGAFIKNRSSVGSIHGHSYVDPTRSAPATVATLSKGPNVPDSPGRPAGTEASDSARSSATIYNSCVSIRRTRTYAASARTASAMLPNKDHGVVVHTARYTGSFNPVKILLRRSGNRTYVLRLTCLSSYSISASARAVCVDGDQYTGRNCS